VRVAIVFVASTVPDRLSSSPTVIAGAVLASNEPWHAPAVLEER
jgi:hypothetical protein